VIANGRWIGKDGRWAPTTAENCCLALPELDVGMLRHDGLPLAGRRRASRLSEHQEVGGGQGEAGREDREGDGAAGRVAIAVMDRTSSMVPNSSARSGWGAPCPA
jgi:hypothetical protein